MAEESPFGALEQSLPICCSLAVVGGVLEVGATAVTAIPSVREAQGMDMKPCLYYMALAGNVSLQLTGSILSHLVATWFGPVSIVVPFFYASTLLSNMGIFGWLLGLEFFSKIMRVGTFVIVLGNILLPVVGPAIQEDQDINELLSHFLAMAWFAILLGAMTVTGILVGFTDITKQPMQMRILILLVARASAISLNLTVSRGFICGPTHGLMVFLLILKIISGAVYTYAIVVQSTAVDQARFVPLNTTTIIVTNAMTGIIIWEDWKVIASWYGYACVFCLLGLGCDLLLHSPVALLTEDNPEFGVYNNASKRLKKRGDNKGSDRKGGYKSIPDTMDGSGHPLMYDDDPTERTFKEAWRNVTLGGLTDNAVQLAETGMMLEQMGEYECALEQYQQCLTIHEQVLGWYSPETASSYMNIGCLLATMGDYDGACVELQKCFAIRKIVLGQDHPQTEDCLRSIEAVIGLLPERRESINKSDRRGSSGGSRRPSQVRWGSTRSLGGSNHHYLQGNSNHYLQGNSNHYRGGNPNRGHQQRNSGGGDSSHHPGRYYQQ